MTLYRKYSHCVSVVYIYTLVCLCTQYQAEVCKKLRLNKASTYGEIVVCDIFNVPNDAKHVLLNCLKTTTTRDKFFEELSRKDSNFTNLHCDDSTVSYILNLNTEDISVVNMLCSFIKKCIAWLILFNCCNKLSYVLIELQNYLFDLYLGLVDIQCTHMYGSKFIYMKIMKQSN